MFEEYQNAKDYAKVYRGENVMKRGIATYQDEAIFLSQDTLHRDMETLKGRPVVIKHQNVTPENMEEKAVGYVTETFYNNEAGTFGCKFVIFDDEAKELIKNGYGLSTCYKPTSFGAGGTEINTPYDREVTGLNFTHLALVPDPRYEDVKIYENGVMEMEEETLLNGGEGSGDFDHAGRPGKVGGSEPAGTGRDGKYNKERQMRLIDDDGIIKKELKKSIKDAKEKLKNLKDFREAYLEYFKSSDEDVEKKYIETGKKVEKLLEDTEIKTDNFDDEEKNKNLKIIDKKIKKLQEIIGINNTQDNAIIEEQTERKNTMENEKMEIPVSFFDKVMDLICNSKKEKKNEEKEIEEVIEEKEEIEAEDEKENKCKKNEVVDKRDILRQIMAIAGKHEDNEDVRTIAKLAEKLAYDKDEREKENSSEDIEYNNDKFFNAMEIAKAKGESDRLPAPETQAKQIERGKEIFG